jgi:predicted CXXCH cytochrome family protein
MKGGALAVAIGVLVVTSGGCNPQSRYEVLSFFFDGVPPPRPPAAPEATEAVPGGSQTRRVGYREHGPYGARLCSACHEPGATNALVAEGEELCLRCHAFKTKRYLHGPLASGGCIACHDPHSSQYRYLLLSESDSFCFRCHEQQAVARASAHANVTEACTVCHDPHSSDRKYLLR